MSLAFPIVLSSLVDVGATTQWLDLLFGFGGEAYEDQDEALEEEEFAADDRGNIHCTSWPKWHGTFRP